MEKKRIYPENTPPGNIPYNVVNPAFRYRAIVPEDDSIIMEVDANGVLYVSSVIQRVATPVLTYEDGIIRATCSTEGAAIYYTVDGSIPTSASYLYDKDIDTTGINIFRFVAIKNGYVNSLEAVIERVARTTVTTDGNKVTITCETEGAKIYYYENEKSTEINIYTGPFSISDGISQIVSFAEKDNCMPSYKNYALRVDLDLDIKDGSLRASTSFGDASIYYTDDGSEPTEHSNLYTVPIEINWGKPILYKFIAKANASIDSVVEVAMPMDNFCIKNNSDSPTEIHLSTKNVDTSEFNFYISVDGEHYSAWNANEDIYIHILGIGESLFIYGTNTCFSGGLEKRSFNFIFHNDVVVEGNLMSLVFGNRSIPPKSLTPQYKGLFSNLFHGQSLMSGYIYLLANGLVQGCYENMLRDCTAMTYITVLAKDWPSDAALAWVEGIAQHGVFKKLSGTTIPEGDDGIPSGWTVIDL